MSRTTHDRSLDHHGTEPGSVVVLDAQMGRYPAGLSLAAVLTDIDSRIAVIEALHGIKYLLAGAIILRTQTPTATADATIAPRRFTANAVIV